MSVAMAVAGTGTVAHADATVNVLHVNNASSANCSDTAAGAGSAATPFCTIQAAADAAVAGDTVDISAGTYGGQVTITTSGTATAPIVYTADAGDVTITSPAGSPAVTLDQVSYVSFEGVRTTDYTSNLTVDGVGVDDSTHIVLDRLTVSVHIYGGSSAVAVTRDEIGALDGAGYLGVTIDPGSSDITVSTNEIASGTHPIYVSGDSDVAVTSNTFLGQQYSGYSIDAVNGSTGVSIENNVLVNTDIGVGYAEILVDKSSAPGTTLDYNVAAVGVNSAAGAEPYSWSGTLYASAALLYQATGQAAHDSNADPGYGNGVTPINDTGPDINSANSAAPGMLSTDFFGNPCTEDPVTPVTGSGSPDYCDRGAIQPPYVAQVNALAPQAGGLGVDLQSFMGVDASVPGALSTQLGELATPGVSYTISWGDKQVQTVQGSGSGYQTSIAHTYAEPGNYTITDTAHLVDGTTRTTTTAFSTAFPDPASTVLELGPHDSSVQVWTGATTGWRTIGGTASAVYAGGAGVFAVSPDGSGIYEYDENAGGWTKIGGAGAQFAVSGDALYELTPDRSAVMRFDGTSWTKVGGAAQALYPATTGVFAASPGDAAGIYKYTAGSWTQLGGPLHAAQFATDGDTLYALGPNGSSVSEWSGTGTTWTTIGGPAGKLYAGGLGLFCVNPGDTAVYQYADGSWTKIGGGGAEFAVSQTGLYGIGSIGGPVFQYAGTPGNWTRIGNSAAGIISG